MITSLFGNWRYNTTDNADFSLANWNDAAWDTMSIPRNWFLGGLDHHGVVWFRYTFDYQPSTDFPFCDLHFDGVDYFCDVYLNGKLLGHHEGYFEPFAFDATDALQTGANVLAVRVDSPFEPVAFEGWHMHKKLIKGVLNHHDMRPGGGWDAVGQSYNTGGIWNRVFLETHGAVTMETVLLQAALETDSPALRAEIRVRNRDEHLQCKLRVDCVPENFKGDGFHDEITIQIPAGDSVHQIELKTPDVQRWQPWDRGFQHLYRVSVDILNVDYTTIFGFRTVHVDEKFNWYINGQRYFMRGSNHLPSQWLSELVFPEIAFEKNHPFGGRRDSAPFLTDVGLMKQANLNVIRIHAHILPQQFYEACDRAGVMVWQDFPLQWGYSDEPTFHNEAERQGRAMVELLYNHPAVVAWCMHNESPWSATWMAGQAGGIYDPTHNSALDERLEKAIQQLDPTRYTHKNSGTRDGHAYPGWYHPHWRDYANAPGQPFCTEYGAQGLPVKESLLKALSEWGPDAGYTSLMEFKAWLEAHKHRSAKAWLMGKLNRPIFALASRFNWLRLKNWVVGAMMSAERSVYRKLPEREGLPPKMQQARNVWESWRFHNFQPAETFEMKIDPGKSLDEFIANSQFYQANLIQFATEHYRRVKFSHVSGIFQFDFSDPWPCITWSVVDYWRKQKPAFDALRQSMQPVLPSLALPLYADAGKTVICGLLAVNDLTDAFPNARINWEVTYGESKIASDAWVVDIPANDVSTSKLVSLPFAKRGEYKVSLQIHAADGALLGENVYQVKAS